MCQKESELVEFKRSTSELKEAVISVAAMLNKGGVAEVYFGIADDGSVLGQAIGRNTIKEVTQTVVDNIEPKVFPVVERRNISGKNCVVIEAHGSDRPYFAYGRAYIRVGESDKALSAREIEKFFMGKKNFLWERELSERTPDDANVGAVREFMRKANTARRVDFEFVNVRTTLHKLHLSSKGYLLRAAEILFCDDNPLEVQAAIFAGSDKMTFLDIKSFKGNLFSLRQQAEIYINSNIKWRAEIKTGPRKEIPEIPTQAVREAVGNSLCHRDYSNPKGNEVAIFKDRIEIYNPGLFPEELEPEDFFSGHEHSILRNPLIAETMYRSKDIERWGSGIKRIHDECVASGIKVEFKRLKTGFVVVFYRPKWEEDSISEEGGQTGGQTGGQRKNMILTDKQKKIIEILKAKPQISRKELALALKINTSAIQKHIKRLKDSGYIKRVGPDFSGYWEVVGE